VVHGDDITSDSSGEDCYRFVKSAGRFLVVKRTPGISTTDLVGRMLLCTKNHFIKSLTAVLEGQEGSGTEEEKKNSAEDLRTRMKDYASDETGLQPGAEVWTWTGSESAKQEHNTEESGAYNKLVSGAGPRSDQRVVYVDGGFDLFSSGHIEFLRAVNTTEEELARKAGWYEPATKDQRIHSSGKNYSPVFLVTGVHDDEVINRWKGVNYPIMNIVERGLCVLQCRYIHALIFSAPFTPTKAYLNSLPYGTPHAVYHGPTAFMPLTYDPYTAPRAMGIFRQVASHDYQGVNAEEIVQRILRSRAMYEERQRLKGVKAIGEEAKRNEEMMQSEQVEGYVEL
jgi:ethanolamine-phosphate cytidylyltransferase